MNSLMNDFHKLNYLRFALTAILFVIVSCTNYDADKTKSVNTPIGSIRDSFDVFRGDFVDMTVTSDNELFLLERNHGVYKADLQTKVWRLILKTGYWNSKIFSIGEKDLFVYEEYADSFSHSADKGKIWEKLPYPSTPINSICSDNEKRIWLVDDKKDLYLSEDKGNSWNKLDLHLNINSILYDKEYHSLLIVSGKKLLKSVDYGLSFFPISTPAYPEHTTESDLPVLNSDKNHYYLHQDRTVYKTDKKHIEWKETGEERKEKTQFPDNPNVKIIATCEVGDHSWSLTDNGYLSEVYNNEVTSYKMSTELPIQLTCKKKDTTLNNMVYFNGIFYYAKDKHIYCKEEAKDILLEKTEKWYRYLDFESKINYLWKNGNGVFLCDENFKKYQINQEIDSIKPYKSEIVDINENKIERITIRKVLALCDGGLSCTSFIYEPRKDNYEKTKTEKLGFYEFEDMPQNISKASVNKLLQCVYNAMSGDTDTFCIKLTKPDLNNYKNKLDKDIALFEKKNIDDTYCVVHEYDYLRDFTKNKPIRLNDLRFLSSCLDTLNISQQMQDLISSKTNIKEDAYDFCCIFLCFNDGNVLMLKDNGIFSVQPDFLRCPWTAFYNREPFLLKSIGVGKCIDEMTQGILLSDCNSKEDALKTILKYLLEASYN